MGDPTPEAHRQRARAYHASHPETARRAHEKGRQRRRDWLAVNGPCRRCGSSADLEVDHVDPSTKESHGVWTWGEAKRNAELAKCQVLCQACHRLKTAKENSESEGLRGIDNGMTKLTEGKVLEIRRRARMGEKQTDLAREFGVTKGTLNGIVHRRTWRYVPEEVVLNV